MNFIADTSFLAYYYQTASGTSGTGLSHIAWYWWIVGASILASWFVSYMLKSRFAKYSQMEIPLTGKQIAQRMLEENGIYDVTVECTPGSLTDHYNPKDKTVNLSESVYDSNTVAAAAVAAHECGHAVQHAKAYHWLTMRSALVPAVQLSSNLVQWVILAGIVLLASGGSPWVLGIGVGLFALTTLFAFVTLPVEFDASRRALAWIQASGVNNTIQYNQAKSALFWAAMTYVVGALSSLAMLLYYAMRFLSAVNDRR